MLFYIFLIHYLSFAIFFYFIFRYGPFKIAIKKNDEIINDFQLKGIYLALICISWITSVPALLLNSFKQK